MEDLFRALPALLKQFDDNEPLRESVIFAAWRKIAGDGLRGHAVPFQLDQKRLIVAVENDRWQKYLKDLSGQMIFKVNSVLGQAMVTYIDFQVNQAAVEKEREKSGRTKIDYEKEREAALEQITPKMRRAADAIKDDDLRYQFLLTAGTLLARKENLKKKS